MKLSWLPALMLTLVLAAPASAEGQKLFPLMVGDPAPKMQVGKWVKGAPVPEFRSGQIYLIEFWATWCPPCRRSIPHLTELQKKYGAGLTIIGVSVWEARPEAVEPFVAKLGERMDYTVAVDDCPPADGGDARKSTRWALEKGKMSVGWMKASGWAENGIPTAFIVNGEGRVAWIGDPEDMDEPLAQIVAGHWDLVAEAEHYRQREELTLKIRPIQQRLDAAIHAKNWNEVIQCCDEMLALDPAGSAHIAGCKFQTLLLETKDADKAYAFAREAIDKVAHHSPNALGQIAYVIVNMSKDGQAHLDLALEAAGRANEVAKGKRPGILETIAQIHFLKGDPKKAVEYETKAIEAAGAFPTADMKKSLEKYQKAAGG